MKNITLNAGGGMGAALGALGGAGLGWLIVPPEPNLPGWVKLLIPGLIVGATAGNYLWESIVKKPKPPL